MPSICANSRRSSGSGSDDVTLAAAGGFERVSALVDEAVETLVADGIVPKWRNEFFADRAGVGRGTAFPARPRRGAVLRRARLRRAFERLAA